MTIALITGGNRGIGRAAAEQLGRRGMTVVLGSRNPSQGEDAAAGLRADGIDAYAVALDVTDPATVAAAAARIDEQFGHLDVLVNNAGVSGALGKGPSQADLDDVRAVFQR